jgi:hypothetical protein
LLGRSRLCGAHTEDTPDFGKRPRLIDFYLEEPTASLARFELRENKTGGDSASPPALVTAVR